MLIKEIKDDVQCLLICRREQFVLASFNSNCQLMRSEKKRSKMLNSNNKGTVPVKKLVEADKVKITKIKDVFNNFFKTDPDFYVRVPGRVNLIGEHIDYSGYSVCPMALEQDILLAISPRNDKRLFLHNLDSTFKDFQCNIDGFHINIGDGAPQWYQYFLCGLKGILDELPGDQTPFGLNVVVRGSIPQSAGLSSSSALVCAAALAAAHCNKLSLTKEWLANICAECEKYIGTQGGGMDQAIAFLATKGCAKLINFAPLSTKDVALPKGAVFVIAHSLTNLNKAATADFNCRVVECRLAAQVMAKKSGLLWSNIRKLGELQAALKSDLPQMIALAEKIFKDYPYTKKEVALELEIDALTLEETSITANTRNIERFELKRRALHVFQEALRVQKFYEACQNSNGNQTLSKLGELMKQSHASLRDLYNCSHPQLDRLVDMSKDLTLGTRLTGAGWGGCCVALVTPQNVDKYIAFITENFYKVLGYEGNLDFVVFATTPKEGACIYASPLIVTKK